MEQHRTYEGICETIAAKLTSRYAETNASAVVLLTGILFAPPTVKLARDEIVPRLGYFDARSGSNVDFFCVGYRKDQPTEDFIKVGATDYYFSDLAFNQFRHELAGRSQWVYSGETDLVLLNARATTAGGPISLDLSTAVLCQLEAMIRANSIDSVGSFLERVFKYAEDPDPNDPASGLSDHLGMGSGKDALMRFVLRLLPHGLGDEYQRAVHFAVRDISPAT